MSIGIWLEGRFSHPYGEGLFSFLTLMLSGIAGSGSKCVICVPSVSVRGFEIWRGELPGKAADLIGIRMQPEASDRPALEGFVRSLETEVAGWLTLRPDYAVTQLFRKPCVSIFADFLPIDYPSLYPTEWMKRKYWETVGVLPYLDKFICFSDYVARRHIAGGFGVALDRIRVLPHGWFDYPEITGTTGWSRAEAADAIRGHLAHSPLQQQDGTQKKQLGTMLAAFPFEQVPYVFVSTRARPHKNVHLVAEALQILLRRYVSLKVVCTAALAWDGDEGSLGRFLVQRGLHWDFVSVNNTPLKVHAALYRCAALTVHPSPFEGGLPFTALESVSSGTPVLIADGPTLREAFGDDDRALFAFDPGSPLALADRITEVLADRDEILARQRAALGGLRASPMSARWGEICAAFAGLAGAPVPTERRRALLSASPGRNARWEVGEHIVSPDRRRSLMLLATGLEVQTFDGAGEVVERRRISALPPDRECAFASLQEDGNLVLYGGDRGALWASRSARPLGSYFLSLDDRGSVSIREGVGPIDAGDPVWRWEG